MLHTARTRSGCVLRAQQASFPQGSDVFPATCRIRRSSARRRGRLHRGGIPARTSQRADARLPRARRIYAGHGLFRQGRKARPRAVLRQNPDVARLHSPSGSGGVVHPRRHSARRVGQSRPQLRLGHRKQRLDHTFAHRADVLLPRHALQERWHLRRARVVAVCRHSAHILARRNTDGGVHGPGLRGLCACQSGGQKAHGHHIRGYGGGRCRVPGRATRLPGRRDGLPPRTGLRLKRQGTSLRRGNRALQGAPLPRRRVGLQRPELRHQHHAVLLVPLHLPANHRKHGHSGACGLRRLLCRKVPRRARQAV